MTPVLSNSSQGKKKIFVDGSHGTTGLELVEQLKKNSQITLLSIPHSLRKDMHTKINLYSKADLVVLCLPDKESESAVKVIEKLWKQRKSKTPKILDTSTHYRTNPQWIYGHPQLFSHQIATAPRVANPGCYAIGFVTLVYPLIKERLIQKNENFSVFASSGYSGGGKNLITHYEQGEQTPPPLLYYGLNLAHKHLPEMKKVCGLIYFPIFLPMVGSYYRGMIVTIPLPYARFTHLKKKLPYQEIGKFLKKFFCDFYRQEKNIIVKSIREAKLHQKNFLSPLFHGDGMEIILSTRADGDVLLIARYDNLGKGASGNALENIQLMLNLSKPQTPTKSRLGSSISSLIR